MIKRTNKDTSETCHISHVQLKELPATPPHLSDFSKVTESVEDQSKEPVLCQRADGEGEALANAIPIPPSWGWGYLPVTGWIRSWQVRVDRLLACCHKHRLLETSHSHSPAHLRCSQAEVSDCHRRPAGWLAAKNSH